VAKRSKFLLFVGCIFSSIYAFGNQSEQWLPNQFDVSEKYFSIVPTFEVSSNGVPFARATKRHLSLDTIFDLENLSGKRIAFARVHFLSWGVFADIHDEEGKKIGSIEEETFRLVPWAEYHILNAADQLVATARMNLFGTRFDLFHPESPMQVYASLSRPLVRWLTDSWSVEVVTPFVFSQNQIDPRLPVFLALLLSDKENRDRQRK
jgi:hypothetical protein